MDRYMSVGDVAKTLGVVPATVRQMMRTGRLRPAAKTEGGMQLFRREDVERLADERERRRANGAQEMEKDAINTETGR